MIFLFVFGFGFFVLGFCVLYMWCLGAYVRFSCRFLCLLLMFCLVEGLGLGDGKLGYSVILLGW